MKTSHLAVAVALASIAVGSVAPGQGTGTPRASDPRPGCCIGKAAPPAAAAAAAKARRFWTKERMRRARPRDLRRVSGAVVAAAGGQPTGAAGRRPPIPPARSAPSAKPAAATPAPTAYGAYLVPDGGYDNMATAFHGRVFAQDRAGIYFCSGTAVTSRRRSVVFTAAHCVYNRRTGWARKFIFVPAFNRGRAPYGRWNWHSMFIPRRWLLRNDKFDYAAVAMRRTRGRKLQDVVGSAGFAWNARPRQDYRIFGYPFGRYRGKRMMTCYRPLALRISYRRQGPRPIGSVVPSRWDRAAAVG